MRPLGESAISEIVEANSKQRQAPHDRIQQESGQFSIETKDAREI